MVSHAIYPGWGEPRHPASLSPVIATRLLRKQSGFRGALFSDDLEMGALADRGALSELGERALAAGCDGLLFCRRVEQAPAIAAAVSGRPLRTRLAEAERRLEKLRAQLRRWKRVAPPPPSIGELRRRLDRLTADVARRQPGKPV